MSASSDSLPAACSTARHLKSLVAHRTAFLAHPRASAIQRRSPGLGDSLPWVLVHCDGDMAEATGIIVNGDFDGDWDLCGRFLLFTLDADPAGEFIRVNGWVGSVSILAAVPPGEGVAPVPARSPEASPLDGASA